MKGTRSRIADLVRQAKCELGSGNRSKALGLLKRALSLDSDGSTITETILIIEKELTGNSSQDTKKKTAPELTSRPEPSVPKSRVTEEKPVAKAPVVEKKTTPEPTPAPKTPVPKPRIAEEKPVAKAPVVEKKTTPEPTPAPKTPVPKPRIAEEKPVAKAPVVEKKTTPEPTPAPKTPVPKPRIAEEKPVAKAPVVEKKTTPEPTPAPRTPAPRPRVAEEKSVVKASEPVKKPAAKKDSPSGNVQSGRAVSTSENRKKIEEGSQKHLIKEIFALSDSALKTGDETGALECLKRAEVLSPDNPEVKKKMADLRKTLKARVMIKSGCDLVAKGRLTDAVKSARKAFDLAPGVSGLMELISDIEDFARRESPAKDETSDYEDAEVWVSRIRSRIQEGAFPLAAELAAEACSIYPEHKLIRTFVDRFTKMKLLPG